MTTYHPPAIVTVEDSFEASRVLRTEWHECTTCGVYVRNDDTESTCNPATIKAHKAFTAKETKRRIIEARMAERQRKFEAAQAEELLYELRTGSRITRH